MGAATLEVVPHKKAHHSDREHDGAKDETHDGIAAAVSTLFNDFNRHDVYFVSGSLPAGRTASIQVPPIRALFAAQSVFCSADRALNFAFGLIQYAFGLKFRVPGHFAGSFFDCALGLIGRAVDAILIHFGGLSISIDDVAITPNPAFMSRVVAYPKKRAVEYRQFCLPCARGG
jgi:hypothetical protein